MQRTPRLTAHRFVPLPFVWSHPSLPPERQCMGGITGHGGLGICDAARLGDPHRRQPAVGSHLCYQLLRIDLGLLGRLDWRDFARFWDGKFHHCRLPLAAQFASGDPIWHNRRVSPDREPDPGSRWTSYRRRGARLPPVRCGVGQVRPRCVASTVDMLPARHWNCRREWDTCVTG
jgi:hypothetical protein